MFCRISLAGRANASRLRIHATRSSLQIPSPACARQARVCLNQTRGIAGGHSGAFNAGASGASRRRVPLIAMALITGGLTVTAMGLWQFYTSNVNKFPVPIRDDLRKALYYQNYGNDPHKAVEYYQTALEAAIVHPDLPIQGPEVTGIMIQYGTLLQDMGRNREAIEVLTACFEALVHGQILGPRYGHLKKAVKEDEGVSAEDKALKQQQEQQQEQEQVEQALLWHGVEDMSLVADETTVETDKIPKHHHASVAHLDGPTRLKVIGVAQTLGDLHQAVKQDKEAERFYVWSVEQLLRDYGPDDAANGKNNNNKKKQGDSNGSSFGAEAPLAHNRELMKKQFDFDNLPAWMSKTDLGASLEALAGFYAMRGQNRNALALYMRALGLSDPETSCHASVIMCNISGALAALGRVDDAVQWAERGLRSSTSLSGQECDESCGVILYNLGMLHEMRGNIVKAEEYYKKSRKQGADMGYSDCVRQSNKALKRLREGSQ